MKIHAEDLTWDELLDLKVVDPTTGTEIPSVVWANDDTGEIATYAGGNDAVVASKRPFRIVRLSTGETVCEAA